LYVSRAVCLQVTAVDADSGINARITYNIEPATNGSTVVDVCCVVNSKSGEVRLSAALTPADVNATYLVAITATDAGTQPLSSSVRVCVTVVERNVSANHLRSDGQHAWLATGSLVFDARVVAALLGSAMLCALVVVVVVCVLIVTRRGRWRTRRHRQLSASKHHPSHYRLVDVWNNGTQNDDSLAEKVQRPPPAVNDDDDDDDGDRCSAAVPRTVIHTLDRSPRSSRNVRTQQRCRRSNISSASTLSRNQADGHINANHFNDVDLRRQTPGSNVV